MRKAASVPRGPRSLAQHAVTVQFDEVGVPLRVPSTRVLSDISFTAARAPRSPSSAARVRAKTSFGRERARAPDWASRFIRSAHEAVAHARVPAVRRSSARPDPPPLSSRSQAKLRLWHKVTLTLNGHAKRRVGERSKPVSRSSNDGHVRPRVGCMAYNVPGYFAADGNAANSSASDGDRWRAHLSPDKAGRWDWRISFVSGRDVAVDASARGTRCLWHHSTAWAARFRVAPSNKTVPDFRALGRLHTSVATICGLRARATIF